LNNISIPNGLVSSATSRGICNGIAAQPGIPSLLPLLHLLPLLPLPTQPKLPRGLLHHHALAAEWSAAHSGLRGRSAVGLQLMAIGFLLSQPLSKPVDNTMIVLKE